MIRAIDLASRAQFWSAERAQAGARALEAQVALAGLPSDTLIHFELGAERAAHSLQRYALT